MREDIISDPFAQKLIRRKARLLAGLTYFTEQDREDFEQELATRLLQSIKSFNSKRGHPYVFITTVIERAVAMILRKRRAKKRRCGPMFSLNPGDHSPEPIDPRADEQDLIDLASDLAEVLTRLPEGHRSLAELLMRRTPAEAARDLGIPPSTLQRRLQHLRRCFEQAGLRNYL